jgi:hypothetical protein
MATSEPIYSLTLNLTHQLLRDNMQVDDEYFFKIKKDTGNSFKVNIKDVLFSITDQNPSSGTPPFITNQNPNGYWETGSLKILTSSAYLADNYGRVQTPSSSSLNFGFSPIEYPFTPKPGDLIRFEYDPNQVYIIYSVIPPSDPTNTEGRIILELDREISQNAERNNFVIYRILNDGKYITCGVKKGASESNLEFTGVIIPKYLSENLNNNLEDIIFKLKQSGIIEN